MPTFAWDACVRFAEASEVQILPSFLMQGIWLAPLTPLTLLSFCPWQHTTEFLMAGGWTSWVGYQDSSMANLPVSSHTC